MANNVDMGQVNWTVKATAEQASDSVRKLSNNINGLSKTLKLVNFVAFIEGCKRIGQTIYKLVGSTNEYIQTMNRFKSIMGESADEAQKFIDKAETILGLDPQQMMTSLSSFQTLTKGFGIASDKAYTMSKNLTQLAADMSSFTGENIELSLQRLKSGISGEIEPMRKWGVALDQATLQETAYRLGINKRVAEMTRAQKTELAYYQIMHATTYAQGNMARTLLTPANALRVIQTEFKQLARAMGSIFIPMVMKVIPYVRALTQILTDLAKKIAAFFGFKMSDYDMSSGVQDISSSFGDLEDNIDGTTKALKKMLMPFDELNNVNFDTGGSGSGVGGVGGSLGLDTYDYDMFANASDEINKKVQEIKNTFEKLKPVLIAVGSILAGLWVVNKIVAFVNWIKAVQAAFAFLAPVASVLKPIVGAISAIAGAILYVKGILDILNPDISYTKGLIEALGGAILVVVGLLLLPISPIAAVVAAIVAAVGIIGVTIWRFRDEIANFFTKTIPDWFNSVVDWLSKLPEKIGYWLGFTLGKIVKFIRDIPNAVASFFTKTIPEWGRKIEEFFTKTIPEKLTQFANFVKELPQKFVEFGKNIIEGLIQGIIDKVEWVKQKVKEFIDGFINGFKDALGIHSPSKVFEDIGIMIIQGLVDGIRFMKESVISIFQNIKTLVINVITNMKDGINEKVSNIKNNVTNIFSGIKDTIVNQINSAKDGVRSAIDKIKSFFNFSWSLPKLKVPHLSWTTTPARGWIADILGALNLPTSLPKLNIDWYEYGGFPETGQLFFANEAGPELVGNIGNRTAVANQQQITEGISEGTYNAFTRALRENKNTDGSNPYLIVNIGDENMYRGYAKKENQYSNMYGVKL